MKFKQYPEYKESGVSWLGNLPKHWETTRTKNIFRLRTEKSGINHSHELLSVYTHIGVRPRRTLEQKGNKASTTDDYWMVYEGDLIVNKLLAWMGAIGVSHYEGVTSPAYDIIRPIQECNTNYYHYLFRTKTYLLQFKARSRGIMNMRLRLYFDQFGQISLIKPPKIEQDRIVVYLRSVEKKINKFIRNKRSLIQLLKEQKQIIINQAVTRGIDPNVKMKPSGVDWLGDIPEHWEIRRLRTVAFVRPSGVDKNTNEGEVPVKLCNYVDVYKNERILHPMDFMNATATPDEITKFKLKSGDVLITKDSETWNDIAVPAFVPENMPGVICAYHLAIIRPMNIDGEFLFRAFLAESVADQFRVSANGVTRYGLSQGVIKDAWFPIPPKKEQTKIVEYINQNLSKIYLAIEKTRREIELIQEYRTRLISDVVTGKVDVRNIKVEDVAEEELLEDVSDTEEIPAYAEASAGREELEDSIEEISDED